MLLKSFAWFDQFLVGRAKHRCCCICADLPRRASRASPNLSGTTALETIPAHQHRQAISTAFAAFAVHEQLPVFDGDHRYREREESPLDIIEASRAQLGK